ncbi:EF-hand domain-containing protein [Actinophytocola oryzae]|uniref:Ca2+-binding EF-hand superfamily protein n=1 Tax=Actinophytocola oryzae TaxID=502181 RepID=A0A4R7W233_9PSEU|nr:EF-hand domain-containing protein [Actinophytocola oryzae]TDV56554.1 Ca2+-binding EF-hand superfamily protein [Actinophytocola oryzae]
MTTQLQERKLDRAFNQLDLDGDGQIEHEDLMGLGARILVAFGESPTSTAGRRIIDRLDVVWDTLRSEVDADQDGQISLSEFRSGMTSAFIDGPKFDSAFRPGLDAVLELCDTDKDGLLSHQEFRALQQAFGTGPDHIDAAFERLDANGDGRLDLDELVAAVREYYTGDDPDAPGTWFFGPL